MFDAPNPDKVKKKKVKNYGKKRSREQRYKFLRR